MTPMRSCTSLKHDIPLSTACQTGAHLEYAVFNLNSSKIEIYKTNFFYML